MSWQRHVMWHRGTRDWEATCTAATVMLRRQPTLPRYFGLTNIIIYKDVTRLHVPVLHCNARLHPTASDRPLLSQHRMQLHACNALQIDFYAGPNDNPLASPSAMPRSEQAEELT